MCGHDNDGVIVNKARQVFMYMGVFRLGILHVQLFKKKSHARLGNVSFPPPPSLIVPFPFCTQGMQNKGWRCEQMAGVTGGERRVRWGGVRMQVPDQWWWCRRWHHPSSLPPSSGGTSFSHHLSFHYPQFSFPPTPRLLLKSYLSSSDSAAPL